VYVETAPGVRLGGVVSLSLFFTHSCAVRADGGAFCWGQAAGDVLGGGSPNEFEPRPRPVLSAPGVPLAGVTSLAVGVSHACAVVAGGQARCWGQNYRGQLGDGDFDASPYARPVLASPGVPLAGAQAIAVGAEHSCAIVAGGQVRCWGAGGQGQLGDNSPVPDFGHESPFPVTVLSAPGAPLAGAQSLASSVYHICAVVAGGQARCWGDNTSSQLGHGFGFDLYASLARPVLAAEGGPNLTGVQSIAMGWFHTCAAVAGGQARCWGDNVAGQLGFEASIPYEAFPLPVLASPGVPLTGAQSIAASARHTGVLTTAGGVLGWGDDAFGQRGNGLSRHRPHPVTVALP
ncbi:MAG TPA: hypothetical protein VFS00_34745, partial [Polyangiaceae bacterium]|nr:hypothetical protein [Polyangiaceae bacterium]